MAKIYHDVTEIVGSTPLVHLNRLDEGLPGNVAVKLEFYNPANSVKDRIGVAMIDALEAAGKITPGKTTLVEPTSGNTGIALALVGAARGYKVILAMPSSMSIERRILLKAYGADLVLTDPAGGLTSRVCTPRSRRTPSPTLSSPPALVSPP